MQVAGTEPAYVFAINLKKTRGRRLAGAAIAVDPRTPRPQAGNSVWARRGGGGIDTFRGGLPATRYSARARASRKPVNLISHIRRPAPCAGNTRLCARYLPGGSLVSYFCGAACSRQWAQPSTSRKPTLAVAFPAHARACYARRYKGRPCA